MNPDSYPLQAVANAATALAGELGLDAVLNAITTAAAEMTQARYAALGVIGDDGRIDTFITHGVDDATIDAIGHYPTGKGLLGLLIRHPEILRLENLHAHPASYGFPPNHPPMTSFLGAPVRLGGRVYGNLYLTEKTGGFTEEDEQLLMVMAAQAGAAIQNALLSARLRDLAVQDERDRISRELHDGVIQSLFSIGLSLESARTLLPAHPERVEQRLNQAVEGLDSGIRELRNAIFHLRPHHAAELGLSEGLAELAREYEVNALVRPVIRLPAGVDALVGEEFVADLLQVAREALSNVVKHARASHVELHLEAPPEGDIALTIRDDGIGFDQTQPAVGRGLQNMRERARALGAELSVVSDDGGTVVWMRVSPQAS